jgi:hypothetical protein
MIDDDFCATLADPSELTLGNDLTSAPEEPVLSVAVLAEGYTQFQYQDFITACISLNDSVTSLGLDHSIRLKPTFRASAQSGADIPDDCPGIPQAMDVDTIYGAGYSGADCRILSGKISKPLCDKLTAGTDEAIIIVNSSRYGGSAGNGIAWFPANHQDSQELALHELGHILNLRDEYDSPHAAMPALHVQLAGQAANGFTNIANDPAATPWEGLKTEDSVFGNPGCPHGGHLGHLPLPTPVRPRRGAPIAAYQGAAYSPCNYYRSMLNCKMRTLGSPFCQVCIATMNSWLSLRSLTPP